MSFANPNQGSGFPQQNIGFGNNMQPMAHQQQIGFGNMFGGVGTNPMPGGGIRSPTQTGFGQQPQPFSQNMFGQQSQPMGQQQFNMGGGYSQPQQNQFTYQQTVVYATLLQPQNMLITVHAQGEVVFQQLNGQKNVLNLGVMLICADVAQSGREMIVGTVKGICNINIQSGQYRQILPNYCYPVGQIRYVSSDYVVASFVNIQNGQIITMPAKNDSAANRWGPAQQSPGAFGYTIELINLDNQSSSNLGPYPCSGLFDVEIINTNHSQTPSYSTDIARIYVPCLPQYIDDEYLIKVLDVRSQGTGRQLKLSDGSTKVSKKAFNIDVLTSGFSQILYIKEHNAIVLTTEAGDIYAAKKQAYSSSYNRGGYYSQYSSGGSSSNQNFLFKFQFNGFRINTMCYDEKNKILIFGLQNGYIGYFSMTSTQPQQMVQLQREITYLSTYSGQGINVGTSIVVCEGSLQTQGQGAVYIKNIAQNGTMFVIQ